ncbi:MAG: hypothetical protein EBY93_06675 [Actinobacteria bacterium]|nr:hypothetical protein [Actinomycetota bacterium]
MARGGNAVVIIKWRDIPAQVNAQMGRERHQVVLSAKFQRAIDRAERPLDRAGVGGTRRQSRGVDHGDRSRTAALAAIVRRDRSYRSRPAVSNHRDHPRETHARAQSGGALRHRRRDRKDGARDRRWGRTRSDPCRDLGRSRGSEADRNRRGGCAAQARR